MPSGTLSSENQADIWYFKTMQTNQDYLLNIDSDRFLNTLRSWINVKVVSDGKVQGVIGTGLYLDPFIKDIFGKRKNTGAKSVIINEFGAIQMDSDIPIFVRIALQQILNLIKQFLLFIPIKTLAFKLKII